MDVQTLEIPKYFLHDLSDRTTLKSNYGMCTYAYKPDKI